MRLRQGLLAFAAAIALAPSAWSLDLLEVWRAGAVHDPGFAAARAARQAGQSRGQQAAALWRPSVTLEAGAGAAASENAIRGAQFSAPGLGQSTGVNFDTSVTSGASARFAIALRQPVYSRERTAQGRQLRIAADMADLEWRAAEQAVMLRGAQLYFDAGLAAQQLRVLEQQEAAVEQARTEAQDRFRIGDRPVTDVHEASARAAALRAQRLAARTELQVKRAMLSDFMGAAGDAALPLPRTTPPTDVGEMTAWLARAAQENPQIRLAQARVDDAQQEAHKTEARLSPTVELMAQIGRDRLSGSGDFGSASQTGTQRALSVQLSVPLYTGGMRSARNAEARALAEKAQAELDRARQQVAQQTRSAWLDLTVGRERTTALEAGLQASLARLDATRVGLQAGDRTTLDLLNAQNDASAAELALLQSRVQLLTDRLRLSALAGELDEGQLAAVNRELSAGAQSRHSP